MNIHSDLFVRVPNASLTPRGVWGGGGAPYFLELFETNDYSQTSNSSLWHSILNVGRHLGQIGFIEAKKLLDTKLNEWNVSKEVRGRKVLVLFEYHCAVVGGAFRPRRAEHTRRSAPAGGRARRQGYHYFHIFSHIKIRILTLLISCWWYSGWTLVKSTVQRAWCTYGERGRLTENNQLFY